MEPLPPLSDKGSSVADATTYSLVDELMSRIHEMQGGDSAAGIASIDRALLALYAMAEGGADLRDVNDVHELFAPLCEAALCG